MLMMAMAAGAQLVRSYSVEDAGANAQIAEQAQEIKGLKAQNAQLIADNEKLIADNEMAGGPMRHTMFGSTDVGALPDSEVAAALSSLFRGGIPLLQDGAPGTPLMPGGEPPDFGRIFEALKRFREAPPALKAAIVAMIPDGPARRKLQASDQVHTIQVTEATVVAVIPYSQPGCTGDGAPWSDNGDDTYVIGVCKALLPVQRGTGVHSQKAVCGCSDEGTPVVNVIWYTRAPCCVADQELSALSQRSRDSTGMRASRTATTTCPSSTGACPSTQTALVAARSTPPPPSIPRMRRLPQPSWR